MKNVSKIMLILCCTQIAHGWFDNPKKKITPPHSLTAVIDKHIDEAQQLITFLQKNCSKSLLNEVSNANNTDKEKLTKAQAIEQLSRVIATIKKHREENPDDNFFSSCNIKSSENSFGASLFVSKKHEPLISCSIPKNIMAEIAVDILNKKNDWSASQRIIMLQQFKAFAEKINIDFSISETLVLQTYVSYVGHIYDMIGAPARPRKIQL